MTIAAVWCKGDLDRYFRVQASIQTHKRRQRAAWLCVFLALGALMYWRNDNVISDDVCAFIRRQSSLAKPANLRAETALHFQIKIQEGVTNPLRIPNL
jgi:hypothetical protein